MLSEQKQKELQRQAYENRDSIMPQDKLWIRCTHAVGPLACFQLSSGQVLKCEMPHFVIGEVYLLVCYRQIVAANGYGRFVDYEFGLVGTEKTVIINGSDAQTLEVCERAWEKDR